MEAIEAATQKLKALTTPAEEKANSRVRDFRVELTRVLEVVTSALGPLNRATREEDEDDYGFHVYNSCTNWLNKYGAH